jgi:uncharacterized protein (TIGR03437 family)
MAIVLVAAYCTPGRGQAVPPPTILNIDVENLVNYSGDVSDPSKFATDPGVTTASAVRNFGTIVILGDIVAVNGQPAKGNFVQHARAVNLNPAANPGQAIADVMRGNASDQVFEIQNADGTAIGSIMTSGLAGAGPPPPGAPLAVTQGNNAIVGGTGAFLGARGHSGQAVTAATVANRQASVTEDPANRRRNGGGKARFVETLIPLTVPQIVTASGGPAVIHSSDFSLVTVSKPAVAGEILSVFVTGLGPTRPGIDPGKPFPASPLAVVGSPVDVVVNGRFAEVTAAVGFPGAVDGYQVNFRVPSDATRGTATIQVSAAWITGPAVTINTQ